MPFSCAGAGHVPASPPVRNQGFEFACCRGCGRDLVRSRGAWRTVPRGFRVVWRQRPPAEAASAAQLLLNLPASGRSLAVLPRPAPRRRRVAAAAEAVAISARGLAGALAERLRAWLKSLLAPPPAAPRMLSLPMP
jgi:hypothetical protein